jgi:hypothetical protein
LAYTIGKTTVGMIEHGFDKLINNTKSKVAFAMKEGSTSAETNLMKKHIIKFNCGIPSTRSVKQVRSQQGSQKLFLHSTISQDINKIERELNFIKFGFNQKSILFLGKNSYVTMSDYAKLYRLEKQNYPKTFQRVPYGMVLYEFSKFKLLNSDSYNSMGIKVHLVEVVNNKYDQLHIYNNTFNKSLKLTDQEDGRIPVNYQLKPLQSSSVMHRMLVTPKCSINSSQFFKNNVKIIRTFSSKLEPGDVLEFNLRVNCGSGIRLDLLKENLIETVGNQPSSYSLILEVIGFDCEAVRLLDGCKFIGTSPGWYTIEYDKGLELCLQNNSIGSTELQGILESEELDIPEYAIKTYRKDPVKEKPLNVDADDIGNPTDKSKTFAIISRTPLNLKAEKDAYPGPAEPKPPKDDWDDLEELSEDEDLLNDLEEKLF